MSTNLISIVRQPLQFFLLHLAVIYGYAISFFCIAFHLGQSSSHTEQTRGEVGGDNKVTLIYDVLSLLSVCCSILD